MRVSLVQLDVSLRGSLEERVAHAADLVRGCAGSDLVVLPELWAHGAWAYDRWADSAETVAGPTVSALASAARDAAVLLHAGSIVERDEAGAFYNTSVVLNAEGTVVATYRKIHRFGFGAGEATLMSAGSEVITIPAGEFTAGLATCYDLRFPELFRLLTDAGSDVLVVASSWPEARRAHWLLLTRARAVENLAYVVACNATGEHGGVRNAGHSIVVDPWGEVLAESGGAETVLTVDLDPAVVAKTRAAFPALRDRRLSAS